MTDISVSCLMESVFVKKVVLWGNINLEEMRFMNMKVYSKNGLEACLSPVFQQYGVKSAILFGSYSKGTASEYSDIVFNSENNSKIR